MTVSLSGTIAGSFDWDDLRFLIAVADNGSAVAAAARLGVNPTTVQRRIANFEKRNAVRLFERRQSGFKPTPECLAIVEASRDIEDRVLGIRREILGRDLRLEGRLAVTSTDTFMYPAMARHLQEFREEHPAIQLELTLTNSRLNLSRQDADIAIRPSNNPPENLVGQRVSGQALAVYATPDLAKRAGLRPEDGVLTVADCDRLGGQPWIGLLGALQGSPVHAWISERVPDDNIVLRTDTFTAVRRAASIGSGFAILPCHKGDADDSLIRITDPIAEVETSIWVLTHPEIRGAAKIRAFMDFITKAMRGDRPMLEGRL